MIIATIIIGIILLFLMFLTFYLSDSKNGDFNDGVTLGMTIASLIFIEVILIGCIISDQHPTAMDVYQDKTTLEYKVVDNVKVDSIVIFKNDDYGKN